MNKNKRIDNPWIKMVKCVDDAAQDEKMSWNITKTNSACNFQNTKFLVTDRRNL